MLARRLPTHTLAVDECVEYALTNPGTIGSFDLILALTAIAFNLLIAGMFIAHKKEIHSELEGTRTQSARTSRA